MQSQPLLYSTDFTEKVEFLLAQQRKFWPLLQKNYMAMSGIRARDFVIEGNAIRLQYNPARIVSTAAKTDSQSIAARPCFLCNENRPSEQKALPFGKDLLILCNPFPIFSKHLTISSHHHSEQSIQGKVALMANLAASLPSFVIFYNGPRCGASAPDHFHFQAGEKFKMPLDQETEIMATERGEVILQKKNLRLVAMDDHLRKYLLLSSPDAQVLEDYFTLLMDALKGFNPPGEEPMVNVHASFHKGEYNLVLFPRQNQRPKQYYETGENNITVSPASVEMGGLIITPLEKDFVKLTPEEIKDIFQQVCMQDDLFHQYLDVVRTQI